MLGAACGSAGVALFETLGLRPAADARVVTMDAVLSGGESPVAAADCSSGSRGWPGGRSSFAVTTSVGGWASAAAATACGRSSLTATFGAAAAGEGWGIDRRDSPRLDWNIAGCAGGDAAAAAWGAGAAAGVGVGRAGCISGLRGVYCSVCSSVC